MPNTMVGLSRLGKKTALIAVLGDDWVGRFGMEELRKEKVDLRFIITKKAQSATAAGFIEQSSGRSDSRMGSTGPLQRLLPMRF